MLHEQLHVCIRRQWETFTYINIYLNLQIRLHVQKHIHIDIFINIHTYICMYIRTHIHIHIHIHMHIHIRIFLSGLGFAFSFCSMFCILNHICGCHGLWTFVNVIHVLNFVFIHWWRIHGTFCFPIVYTCKPHGWTYTKRKISNRINWWQQLESSICYTIKW
jgi:hypothetical protein